LALALLTLAAVCSNGILSGPAGAATPTVGTTSQILHFAVHIGPGQTETCDVLGDVFTPAGASAAHRVPSLLTTNGFGGSYSDQIGLAKEFASEGYVVLTYSGLGFGNSGCPITLDDPLYDGEAASQLVSFLGGENGIAFADAAHKTAIGGLNDVIHDAVDHLGHADQFDPRVGMIGGSYGGEIQFAAASVDPRIDTIVPFITWNNLAYSLAPNDASASPSEADYTPGVVKSSWALLFSADGVLDGLASAKVDPARLVGCPNFATWVCPSLLFGGALGYPYPAMVANLEHASVTTYTSSVHIPTLLLQGENDTLFNLNEAIANYQALQTQGTPVDMIWQSWGHSDSTPAPGEIDLGNPDPTTQYETLRIVLWFDHYLKGLSVPTGPGFAYFRDWISYKGNASPAYASAPSFPTGTERSFYLSGGGQLAAAADQVTHSTQALVTPGAGLPTSVAPPDAIGGAVPTLAGLPETNLPGTAATWESAPLLAPLEVVGPPRLTITVQAPSAAVSQLSGPAGQLTVFAKLYDVAPNGTATLIHGLVAPARIPNVNQPVTITLPAIVHQFGVGHRLEIEVAGGDINYRGGNLPTPVIITTGSSSQVLTVPVVAP
jgi:ABC-2 type transport system ATP-binding protein